VNPERIGIRIKYLCANKTIGTVGLIGERLSLHESVGKYIRAYIGLHDRVWIAEHHRRDAGLTHASAPGTQRGH
jgi:hypothetical protein